jgi:type IV pilus modification protein PilV
MHARRHDRGQAGFSLIEVLIAVVVLATGLLAMAALQARLASNSADAKARSRVASLMTSVIEDERATGYGSLATYASTSCTTATPTTLQTSICTAQSDAGISGLSLTQTVTQFYGLSGGGAFTTTVPGAGANYADYKRIVLTARWTDAAGASRTLSTTTIASLLNISASTTIISNPLTATGTTPVVHEQNPSLTPGVIPIAVGANTDTASTNPRPTVGVTMPSTTFNTLTYSSGGLDSSISATIQKRVETTVAECVCQLYASNPLSDDVFLGAATYRPTYWNGFKYVAPSNAQVTPYSAQHPDLVGAQSDVCTVVCRDHHDKNERTNVATTGTVLYDSVTGDANRYKATVTVSGSGNNATASVTLTLSNNQPVAASGTDAYLDAARLIRVDGIWRVATDMHAEHMGLLATTPRGVATSSAPDSSSEAEYEDFVVDYMGQKLTQLLGNGVAPVANTVYNNHGLDAPDTIDAVTTSGSYRYLHARGLYLDTLETAAINKLTSVNSTCTDYPTCLLPYLPFNTINVTQLADWKARSASATTNGKITITNSTTSNSATSCSGSSMPIRACVSGSNASSGTSNLDQAIATYGKSNSAVAASSPISPYELNSSNKLTDSQQFTVTGTSTASEFFANVSGPSTSVGSTTLSFWTDDLSTTNEPWIRWAVGSAADYCFSNISRTDTNPNPYDCVTTVPLTWSSAAPLQVTVGNYNQVVQQQVSNPCPGGTGTYNRPTLVCYKVATASVANSGSGNYNAAIQPSTNVKTPSEQTQINITGNGGAANPIPMGQATLNLTFSTNGTATGSVTCDAVTAVPTFTTPTSCN